MNLSTAILYIVLAFFLWPLKPIEVFGQNQYEATEIFQMKKRFQRSDDGYLEVHHFTNTKVTSSWASAELVVVKILTDTRFELHDFREVNSVENLIEKIPYGSQPPLAIMSGGFYDKDGNGGKIPIGLVISNKLEINNFYRWNEGGILIQQPEEGFLIVPVGLYEIMDFGMIDHAVQSLPLVVEGGEAAIRSASHSKGHRIGIGYDKEGNTIIVCAFAPHSASFSLYDLAHLLTYAKNKGGPELETFIALDGGPSIYLKIPSLGLEFGRKSDEQDYIVNLISIMKR